MSRIITANYNDKLNLLIEGFEQAPNFSLFLDFLLREVENDFNQKVNRNQKVFSANEYENLKEISESILLKRIFAYLKVIIKGFDKRYLHIHINQDIDEKLIENIIALFAWETNSLANYDKDLLNIEINNLINTTSRDLYFNDNNGHNENRLRRERKGLKHRLKLIEIINSFHDYSISDALLLNLNTSAQSAVNISEFSVCPESKNTYVNFGNNRKDIFRAMGREKVERLSIIINLFPSITGKNIWFKDFISDEINRYNNFKKVVTITSGEKTPEALLEMQKQNKFQAEEVYTIFSFEI